MGSCNTAQNEKSGKDLLLKICKEIEIDVVFATDDEAFNATAHGLVAGDLVRFGVETLGAVTGVTVGQLYFVVSTTANSFKISATPGGAAVGVSGDLTDVTIEVFQTVGGLRSKSIAFNAEAIDVSNHGSNQWKQIKDAAGMRSVSVSGSGVYVNEAVFKAMESQAFAQTLVCLAFIDASAGRCYSGCFKITSLENAGEYDGEATYSMSAESSGAVTIYQAA